MLTLHLIRHGDTEASGDGVLCGDLDPPLAPSGILQAEALVARTTTLGLSALYVSHKLRARMTAEPTCRATGLTPRVEPDLREIAYGAWEGKREKDLRAGDAERFAAWNHDPALHAPPGGESGYAIAARALPVIDRIHAEHGSTPGAHIAVVSHKATIRIIVSALIGLHLGRFRDAVGCPTASLSTIEFHERGPLLVRLGEQVLPPAAAR